LANPRPHKGIRRIRKAQRLQPKNSFELVFSPKRGNHQIQGRKLRKQTIATKKVKEWGGVGVYGGDGTRKGNE
jgi:hypothetical protein